MQKARKTDLLIYQTYNYDYDNNGRSECSHYISGSIIIP